MPKSEFTGRKITVIGAGAWGTTLADLIGRQDYLVRLWCLEPEVAEHIKLGRENEMYLRGVSLSENITPTLDLEEALTDVGLILIVVPSQHFRNVAAKSRPFISAKCYALSASKGFEIETFKRMSEVLAQERAGLEYAAGVLSGPNLSREISAGKPAVTLVASENEDLVHTFQHLLSCRHFRVYRGADVTGTELGGALKNIYAIAAGVVQGFNFGNNTLASLITRGLVEMIRLGVSLGAKTETFYGASGLGDLICTAFSELSRNNYVGRQLAAGEKLDDILASMHHVAEGVYTTKAVHKHLGESGIEMPIAEAVYSVLFEGFDPLEGVHALMGRDLKAE